MAKFVALCLVSVFAVACGGSSTPADMPAGADTAPPATDSMPAATGAPATDAPPADAAPTASPDAAPAP